MSIEQGPEGGQETLRTSGRKCTWAEGMATAGAGAGEQGAMEGPALGFSLEGAPVTGGAQPDSRSRLLAACGEQTD